MLLLVFVGILLHAIPDLPSPPDVQPRLAGYTRPSFLPLLGLSVDANQPFVVNKEYGVPVSYSVSAQGDLASLLHVDRVWLKLGPAIECRLSVVSIVNFGLIKPSSKANVRARLKLSCEVGCKPMLRCTMADMAEMPLECERGCVQEHG